MSRDDAAGIGAWRRHLGLARQRRSPPLGADPGRNLRQAAPHHALYLGAPTALAPRPRQRGRDGDEARMALRVPTLSDSRSSLSGPGPEPPPAPTRSHPVQARAPAGFRATHRCGDRQRWSCPAGAGVPGWRVAQRRGPRAPARFHHHACGSCPSAARGSARSEFCRAPPARAAQAQLAPEAPTTRPAGPSGVRPPLSRTSPRPRPHHGVPRGTSALPGSGARRAYNVGLEAGEPHGISEGL